MREKITIGWKVSSPTMSLASVRYRAILPMLALEAFDVKSRIFADANSSSLAGLDALVIVKSFTIEDYWLAQQAAQRRIPIVFDLCDNIFIEEYKGKGTVTPTEIFLLIAGLASAVVVTTEPLANSVRQRVGQRLPIHVIPDGIETPQLLAASAPRMKLLRLHLVLKRLKEKIGPLQLIGRTVAFPLKERSRMLKKRIPEFAKKVKRVERYMHGRYWLKKAYRHYDRVRTFVRTLRTEAAPSVGRASLDVPASTGESRRSAEKVPSPRLQAAPGARKILWFGNHGAAHANFGMLDLLTIRDALERVAAERSVELVVVSNNRRKYDAHIAPMAIPSRYVEWSMKGMEQCFREADVVVIPNSLDEFSIGKSANRTVLALSHGVPVVATATPALKPLGECIVLDDFEGGIRRYLNDRSFAERHVHEGRKLIQELFGQHAIGLAWRNTIDRLLVEPPPSHEVPEPALIVAVQVPQDLDMARPVLAEMARQGVQCAVWTCLGAIRRWPQIAEAIKHSEFPSRVLLDNLEEVNPRIFPASARALLTATETNLLPHRFTHELTKAANSAGLFTATMQHGFENVGLSYSDAVHDIQRIEFASRRIYTWGPPDTLHDRIPERIKRKCLPVGCPKPAEAPQKKLGHLLPDARTVIGVFENLHWHRYSPEYVNFFLDGVRQLAAEFPDVIFLVKPHNAGMWLTGRYKGERPQGDNLVIVDPKSADWSAVTAPQILGALAAVITTPSTVALDAARVGLPTAVVAESLELANYAPLPAIKDLQDWIRFVQDALDTKARDSLSALSTQFVERVLLPGDATRRILDEIMSYQMEPEANHAS